MLGAIWAPAVGPFARACAQKAKLVCSVLCTSKQPAVAAIFRTPEREVPYHLNSANCTQAAKQHVQDRGTHVETELPCCKGCWQGAWAVRWIMVAVPRRINRHLRRRCVGSKKSLQVCRPLAVNLYTPMVALAGQ